MIELFHCFIMFSLSLPKIVWILFSNAYGPSLPILSGISRINFSSPVLLNQGKFSRIFNILKYFFSSKNYSLFNSFHLPDITFSDFILSVYFPFVSQSFCLASFSQDYQQPHSLQNLILLSIRYPFSVLAHFRCYSQIRSKIRCWERKNLNQTRIIGQSSQESEKNKLTTFPCLN